jgi:membrane-associated protein
MPHHTLGLLRDAIIHYGYWAVAAALLLESAGLPLPGETALLLASFLAYSEHELSLPWIIVVATLAATLGGEVGFVLGRSGGRPLINRYRRLFHISAVALNRGDELFDRHGAVTIFFARFIFGMRVLASLLAGALHMPRRKFTLYNFLGAAVWVTVISCAGYTFGSRWHFLMYYIHRLNVLLVAALVIVILILWRRNRRARTR